MTAGPAAPERARTSVVRRAARSVLAFAVRGRRDRGGDWGEALLAEFAETRTDREAVRWAVSGLRAVWQERRRRARELPRPIRIGRRVAVVALLGIVGGLAIDRFVLSIDVVLTGSMSPTLEPGDRALDAKILVRAERGDMVVLRRDRNHAARIKRVIGLPGDTIACRDGRLLVNGARLDEPYLPADPDEARTDCADVTVPAGHLYVLGDHRVVSQDSRQEGPVRREAVEARVLTRVWPVGRA